MSTHETACDAAREAAGLLRVWATTEGDCKPMKSLWLVTGRSEKSADFVRVVSADDRLDAVAVLAKSMGLSCDTSWDNDEELRVIIHDASQRYDWKASRCSWMISCSPIEFGVNMIDEVAWEWEEELDR